MGRRQEVRGSSRVLCGQAKAFPKGSLNLSAIVDRVVARRTGYAGVPRLLGNVIPSF